MRKQQSQKKQARKQLHGNQSYRKQAAVAAGLMAGGMSAFMITAMPASAETSYRDALDTCVTAPSRHDTVAECVEKIQAPKSPTSALKSVAPTPAPAAPANVAPPENTGSGLAGTVTSGADRVAPVGMQPAPATVQDLPDGPTLQRRIAAKAVEHVQALDRSVDGTVADPSSDHGPEREAPPAGRPAGPPAEQQSTNEPAPVDDWMSGALARLRQCESSGNYGANTGNGYYGAYQFSPRTWNSLGFDGYPHQASPAVQDQAAIALQARDGWGQWPSCSRRLNLL